MNCSAICPYTDALASILHNGICTGHHHSSIVTLSVTGETQPTGGKLCPCDWYSAMQFPIAWCGHILTCCFRPASPSAVPLLCFPSNNAILLRREKPGSDQPCYQQASVSDGNERTSINNGEGREREREMQRSGEKKPINLMK